MRKQQINTIRLKLLKIAAKVVHSARNITFKLCSSCPYKGELYETLENVRGGAAKAGITVTPNLDSRTCEFDEYRDTIPFIIKTCLHMSCSTVQKSKIELYDGDYILMNNSELILLKNCIR